MPDFSMCDNEDCPLSWNCWRFNAPPNGYRTPDGEFVVVQAYAGFTPDEDGTCDYYWPQDKNTIT